MASVSLTVLSKSQVSAWTKPGAGLSWRTVHRSACCRQPAPAALRPAAEYAPGLAARFHLVAEAPPEPFRPAPVKAQVARFDPSALIRFPPLVARWLAMMKAVKAANQSRVAEVAER